MENQEGDKDKTTIEYLEIIANILEKGIKKYLNDVYNSN